PNTIPIDITSFGGNSVAQDDGANMVPDSSTPTTFHVTQLFLQDPDAGMGLPQTFELEADPGDLSSDTGQTSVTDLGNGQFQVQSFFDVFVDITLDGQFSGTTDGLPNSSADTNGPVDLHFVLVNAPAPEPATLALLGFGLLGLSAGHR